MIFSGATEIVLALGLLWPGTRKVSGWLFIIRLLAIFPANIYVAVMELPAPGGLPAGPWYKWSQLYFQPLYILDMEGGPVIQKPENADICEELLRNKERKF